MPDYVDPVDAATRQPQIGGTSGPYAQTDVWHDRNWLIANLQRHDSVAKAAAVQLRHLDQQDAFRQRSQADDQRTAMQYQALNQRQADFEANQRRMMAHTNALESNKQLSIDRNTEIDEQGHAMLQTMGQLDAALRNGQISKDDYDSALLQAGAQYPLAMRHPEAAKHYEFAVTEADKQNDFNARQQFREAARVGAKYGIGVQADPETGLPSVEHTQLAALQTPKGRNEALGAMNTEMARKYGITTGVSSLFNPVAPHVGTDAQGNQVDNPTHIALPFVQTTGQNAGQIGKLPVPIPLFNQMKQDFGDRYFALNPPSAVQPAGAVAQTPTTQPSTAPAAQIPDISSANDYQALPAGSTFMSGGKQYTKPAEQAQ